MKTFVWRTWRGLVAVLLTNLVTAGVVAAADDPQAPETVLYVGCGARVSGSGWIYQLSEQGDVIGRLEFPARPLGLAWRGDYLYAVTASARLGEGALWEIGPAGKIERLPVEPPIGAGIDLAVMPNAQDILLCDNERHAVLRVASPELRRVEVLVPAPLVSDQEHFPSMSIAVTSDHAMLFSASDPPGVFRLPEDSTDKLPKPLLADYAGLAAEPNSTHWAALSDDALRILDEDKVVRTAAAPEGKAFWRRRVVCFTPQGSVLAVVEAPQGLELFSLDVDSGTWTRIGPWHREPIMAMTYGPQLQWPK